jgi:hypothetical protein
MSYSGMSRYNFGPLFGIDHGDKPKVAIAHDLTQGLGQEVEDRLVQ